MSTQQEYYKVETDRDITSSVASMSVKFNSSGIISTANIELIATDGVYITSQPLDENDKVTITIEDEFNVRRSKIFEVQTILPQDTAGGGTMLAIELSERAISLQDLQFTALYRGEKIVKILENLVLRYNSIKGSEQPTLILDLSRVPDLTVDADFTTGWSYYDAINHIIERLSLPVDAGGYGEYYSTIIEDIDDSTIGMTIKIQGTDHRPGKAARRISGNTHQLTGQRDRREATVVLAEGQAGSGHWPPEYDQYISHIEFWNNLPEFVEGTAYKSGIFVRRGTVSYLAVRDTANAPPHGDWRRINNVRELMGAKNLTQTYSPLTEGRLEDWKTSLGIQTNARGTVVSGHVPDGNLVIRTNEIERDWAHVTVSGSRLPDTHELGYRILVRGRPVGVTHDINGNSLEDALIIFDGTGWIVRYRKDTMVGDYDEKIYQVAVLGDSEIYEYSETNATRGPQPGRRAANNSTPAWHPTKSGAGAFSVAGRLKNDCFHQPLRIEQIDGILNMAGKEEDANYRPRSGIRLEYQLGTLGNKEVKDRGWWAAIRFPIFGSAEFPLLETVNSQKTRAGSYGYNSDNDSEFGEYEAIRIAMKPTIGTRKDDGSIDPLPFTANLAFTIIMYDMFGNIVDTRYSFPHNSNIEFMDLQFSSFAVRKTYAPLDFWSSLFLPLFTPKQLEFRDHFDFRRIQMIVIQSDHAYDEYDRYDAFDEGRLASGIYAGLAQILNPFENDAFVFRVDFDAVLLGKTPLATSGNNTERPIMPDIIQQPRVRNFLQLESIAKAELARKSFRYRSYQLQTDLDCDWREESSVLLTHPDLTDGDLKMVIKSLNYTFNAGGGALLNITLAERIGAN